VFVFVGSCGTEVDVSMVGAVLMDWRTEYHNYPWYYSLQIHWNVHLLWY